MRKISSEPQVLTARLTLNPMKTEALNKCLNVITNWRELDDAERNELTTIKHRFGKNFIEPFRRELGLNLLTKPTFQEKKDLITFYVDELDRVIIISENFKNIQPVDLITDELLAPIW